ncbi:hypothetical protein GQ457_12G032230 [Hibiscus cannabinus]
MRPPTLRIKEHPVVHSSRNLNNSVMIKLLTLRSSCHDCGEHGVGQARGKYDTPEEEVRLILDVVKGDIILNNRKRADLFLELKEKESVWPNTISIPLLIILPIWKLKWPTAAKKNPVLSLTEISESIGGINISGEDAEVAAPAKNGGRKPAANSKAGKPPAVARKRAPAAAGKQQQKLLTQMLKPTSVAERCFSAILNKQLELRISHQWKSWLIISYKSISIESNKLENFEILRFFHFPVLDERLEVRRPSEQAMWQAHRGRVSCKRDFPPFCGRHAPPLKSKEFKRCVHDISQGKEIIPICAINNIDGEKPPPFEYVAHMIHPNWCCPIPSIGCDCLDGCSQSNECSCVTKNGGDLPYNHDGAVVEIKPLVYECGPACKCPSSCYNRVGQHGIKFQFEIFRTESKGLGVRSLNFNPSGSFICEYVGEVLEDSQAEKRTGNGDYLFDIGNSYGDNSPQGVSESFTIDAARFGCFSAILNKQLELRISHQWKSWLIISYKSISIESNKLENFKILRFLHFPVLDERLEVHRPSEQAMWQAHQGRVSCKRDFPPFCGRHAPPLRRHSERAMRQADHRKRVSCERHFPPFGGRHAPPLERHSGVFLQFSTNNLNFASAINGNPGSSSLLDERLEVRRPSEQAMWQAHRGRVSCKRDFPPFCGRHAPPLKRHSEQAMRQADHRKRVSCERHFPPFCGRHAPPLKRHSVKKSKDVKYVGEVLEDSEAEKRKGNGDYLFDIGNSYGDSSPQGVSESFTIDAARSRLHSEQAMWQAHRGRVSCKRDFPPFCGRHAPPLKRHSERAMRQADYRKRVSCERHFPPFCGRNAPPLKRHSVKKSKDVYMISHKERR